MSDVTAKHGDIWRSPCGTVELRCGRYQDVLADVECDAMATDPPYSKRTHSGHDAGSRQRVQLRGETYSPIDYAWWGEAEIAALYSWAEPRVRGWIFGFTDDWLARAYREAAEAIGRYSFAGVPWICFRPRLMGDGPASCVCYGMASRPRTTAYSRWACLPGWYRIQQDRDAISGGKPLRLMRAIVRDYSRPGDLICDPCAGGGTTLLAAAIEGRRAIGAEMDPETYGKAVRRLAKGWTKGTLWEPEQVSMEQTKMEGL